MDSQLAAVLTHGRAGLLNRAQIPQGEGKLMEPLKETKDGPEIQPMDLSLKSSSSPTSSSRPLSLNQTTTSHNETKHIHCKDESLQGRILGEVEDYKENTSLEGTGVHHPILPNIGSTPACTKDLHTSALTRCLSEQRGVLSDSSPTELSHHTSLTLVTVKEEIEEVCIGEMEGHSEGDSDSVVSLSEIIPEDKDSVEDSADGSYFHSTFVTEPQKSTDGIAAIKKELDDIATDVCRTETKEAEVVKASVVDTQTLDLNGNISYFSEAVTGLDTKTQTNTGSSSGSDKLTDAGLSVQQKGVVELKQEKCKKLEKACFTVVPAHSIGTRSQRKREMEKNTSLYKDGLKLEVVQSSVLLFSDPPTGCGGLSNSDKESLLEENLNEMVKGKGIKRGIDGEEVLDLSFSRKTGRNGTDRKEGGFKKGTGNESTLVMEVEEIVQQEATEKESNEAHVTFEEPHWDSTQSPSPTSPSSSSSPVDPDLAELLLIDDQGIPYRLTPDGQKVLQVASPKPCIGPTISQPKPTLKLGLAEESPDISTAAYAPSNRGSAHALPILSPKKLSSRLTSAVSLESSTAWKPILPLNTKFSTETAVLTSPPPPSSVSNMTSQPVRILANSASNILLVPSSHLSSPSLSKTSPSSGLLTVSLPLSLSQNIPSAPLLLVLSPLTASPAPPSSSSSSSPLTVVDPIPSSVLISNNQSSSSVAHSLSSGSVDLGSSSTSSALLPAHNLNSISSTTSISGNGNQTIPNLASPSVSPVTTTKKSKPDLNSETIFPKRSPRLLKANFPSEPESTSTTEAKTESETSCVPNSLSPVKTRQPLSPQTTPNPLVPHSSKKGLSPVAQPAATSHTPEELISNEPLYCTSSTPPPTPIFPTNHPKNLSLSPTCPRRILYCQFCPRAFYYLSDLERHSITHSQSKPHICPLCSKAFKRSSHLERHKHIHTGQRNFICPICSKRFREAGELLRHQRVHTGEKPFQCPQCHMRFAERNTLRRHTKRKHHDGQPGEDGQLEGGHASDSMQGGQEESAEWYSCSVPDLDSDPEPDRE